MKENYDLAVLLIDSSSLIKLNTNYDCINKGLHKTIGYIYTFIKATTQRGMSHNAELLTLGIYGILIALYPRKH